MMCTKLDLHRDWRREERDLANLNGDEKSDKILENLKCQRLPELS